MPRYLIRMINSEFESFEENEYPSLAAVREAAIGTATRIAAESVSDGAASAAVELQIREGEAMVARHVVTLSVSDVSGAKALN